MRAMPSPAFDRLVLPLVQDLAWRCAVACSTEDPGTVFGFSCIEDDVVHMVFVKSRFRRFGVARMLLAGVGSEATYSIVTPQLRRMIRAGKIPSSWVYDDAGMWRSREAS